MIIHGSSVVLGDPRRKFTTLSFLNGQLVYFLTWDFSTITKSLFRGVIDIFFLFFRHSYLNRERFLNVIRFDTGNFYTPTVACGAVLTELVVGTSMLV